MSNEYLVKKLGHYPFGQTINESLNWSDIEHAVKENATFASITLPALLHTGRKIDNKSNITHIGAVEKRFLKIAKFMFEYITEDRICTTREVEGHLDDAILDFRVFASLCDVSYEHYGQGEREILDQLVAVFCIRYKIDEHLSDQARFSDETQVGYEQLCAASLGNNAYFSVEEIAVACGMKLESVRNAIRRKELNLEEFSNLGRKETRGRKPKKQIIEFGVKVTEAFPWMAKRPGFMWPTAYFEFDENLPISGRQADSFIEKMDLLDPIYADPGKNVRTWKGKGSDKIFMINSGGKRKCIVTLPCEPNEALLELELKFRDRSNDPTSHFYARGFPEGRPSTLFQAEIPNLYTLSVFIKYFTN